MAIVFADKDNNPVVIGEPTKADDYDEVFDNTLANRDLILGDNAQASGETGHGHTGTGLNDGVLIEKEAIAATDHPAGFRVYMSTTAIDPIDWDNENFDEGDNFDLANEKYIVPSNGVYFLGVQITFLPSGGVGTYTVEIVKDAAVIAVGKTSPISDGDEQSILVTTLSKLVAAEDITIDIGRSGAGAGVSTGVAGTTKSFFYGHKLPFTTDY